jgi:acetyl-CoA carboxylase carboxyltransferase component
VTALARLGGRSVAIVASQPRVAGGAIDGDAADKATHLLDVADAFHLPVVFLADTPGLAAGSEAERAATLRRAARMLAAVARLRSPKLHVTLRRAHGLGGPLMGLGAFGGQTVTLALPGARTGGVPAETGAASRDVSAATDAVALLDHSELGGAYANAETVVYDDVIEPCELRDALLGALRLGSDRDAGPVAPAAHHGVRP